MLYRSEESAEFRPSAALAVWIKRDSVPVTKWTINQIVF